MPRITVRTKEGQVRNFVLNIERPIKIGRSEDNDIVLYDIFVSRYHAKIRSEEGKFILDDLDSTHGTMVNNKKIKNFVLTDKDIIQVGKTILIYEENKLPNITQRNTIIALEHGWKSAVMNIEIPEELSEKINSFGSILQKNLGGFLKASGLSEQIDPFLKSVKELQKEISDTKKAQQRTETLYEIGKLINSVLDLDELLNLIMDLVLKVMTAKRGFLMLSDSNTGELTPKIIHNMGTDIRPSFNDEAIGTPQELQSNALSFTIAKRVVERGEPVLTLDAMSDQRFMGCASVIKYNIHSVLCVPLNNKEQEVIGVIYVDNLAATGYFSPEDQEFLSAFANQAAIAIENARLYTELAARERLKREIEIAHNIQMNMLPKKMPESPHFDLAACVLPAKEVGGDFYDFMLLDDGNKLAIVTGDVSGKGVPGAMIMAISRGILRSEINDHRTPSEVIKETNKWLYSDTTKGMFVATFYGLLDLSSKELVYVNCGQPFALYYNSESSSIETLSLNKMRLPLGIFNNIEYDEKRVQLHSGDILILYSDGLLEALNPEGEAFEEEQLQASLKFDKNKSASEILEEILEYLNDFVAGAEPFDDITLLILKLH